LLFFDAPLGHVGYILGRHSFLIKGNRRSLLRIKTWCIMFLCEEYVYNIHMPGVWPIHSSLEISFTCYRNPGILYTMIMVWGGVCHSWACVCLFEREINLYEYNIHTGTQGYNVNNIIYDAVFRWNFEFQYFIMLYSRTSIIRPPINRLSRLTVRSHLHGLLTRCSKILSPCVWVGYK